MPLKTGSFWLVAAVLLPLPAVAADPAAPPGLALSKDGAHVIDLRSRLVWSRCVEGMQWNGRTCSGEAQLASHAEALALARARARADGLPWRVPRVAELRRLVNRAAKLPRAAPQLLPQDPQGWHWAITANVDTRPVNQYNYGNVARGLNEGNANRLAFLHGWAVDMGTGAARGDLLRSEKLPVRLVWQEQ